MPLPKPRQNESENEFVARCTLDAEIQREFPRNEQAVAVCHSLYTQETKAFDLDYQKFVKGLERKRDIEERNWTRKFTRFYYQEYSKGIDQFLQTNTIQENSIFRFMDFEDLMTSLYVSMGWEIASWYMLNINGTKYQKKAVSTNPNDMRGIWEQQILRFAKIYCAEEIRLIQGTALVKLKRIVRSLLSDAEFMSLGIQEKGRILKNQFKQISQWQAKRIVRTETTTIANYAIDQSATTMFPKDQIEKRWITSVDGFERAWHNAMSNKTKPYSQPFEVYYPKGMDLMMTAGEVGASGANRVNCRCVVVMTPKPDPFGL